MAGPMAASSSSGRAPNVDRRCAPAACGTPLALRYPDRRDETSAARGRPGGRGGRARAARAPRLPGAARLASCRIAVARRSQLDPLQPHVGVAEQLGDRLSLVLALVEDAPD